MATHSGRELTDAIITALRAASLVVGDGDKSNGAETGGWSATPGQSAFTPYVVVFPTPGGYYDGSIAEPFADARPDYVISAFGGTREQAQWGADKVYATLLDPSNVTVTGRTVQLLSPDVDGGTIRDDDVSPPIYHSPSRWRVMTTG